MSKVRSLTLDTWDLETVAIMEGIGNTKVNKIYEYKLPANQKLTVNASSNERNEYIRSKYIDKKWVPNFEELQKDAELIGKAMLIFSVLCKRKSAQVTLYMGQE